MSQEKKKKTEDSPFREWLSDNLRYIVLIIAVLLIIIVIVMIMALLKSRRDGSAGAGNQEAGSQIVIMSETSGETESGKTQAVTEKVTEKQTGKATEKQTEKATEKQTEKATEKQTEKATEKQTEKATEKQTTKATEKQTTKATEKQTTKTTEKKTKKTTEKTASGKVSGIGTSDLDSVLPEETAEKPSASVRKTTILASGSSSVKGNTSSVTNMDTGDSVGNYSSDARLSSTSLPSSGDSSAADGETPIDILPGSSTAESAAPETTPETQAPATATIVSACNIRSYPDYGDNVIGSCYGGETVTYYGIEGGWAKIELNGVIGYVGPSFVS